MKHLAPLVVVLTLAAPASAQDAQTLPEVGEDLMERLEELTKPLLPMIRDFTDQLDDFPGYHPPEVLPNGDILIRRKAPDLPAPQQEPVPQDEGPIDL